MDNNNDKLEYQLSIDQSDDGIEHDTLNFSGTSEPRSDVNGQLSPYDDKELANRQHVADTSSKNHDSLLEDDNSSVHRSTTKLIWSILKICFLICVPLLFIGLALVVLGAVGLPDSFNLLLPGVPIFVFAAILFVTSLVLLCVYKVRKMRTYEFGNAKGDDVPTFTNAAYSGNTDQMVPLEDPEIGDLSPTEDQQIKHTHYRKRRDSNRQDVKEDENAIEDDPKLLAFTKDDTVFLEGEPDSDVKTGDVTTDTDSNQSHSADEEVVRADDQSDSSAEDVTNDTEPRHFQIITDGQIEFSAEDSYSDSDHKDDSNNSTNSRHSSSEDDMQVQGYDISDLNQEHDDVMPVAKTSDSNSTDGDDVPDETLSNASSVEGAITDMISGYGIEMQDDSQSHSSLEEVDELSKV